MDFSVEDHLDSAKFNRVVWQGVMGGSKAYPWYRTGEDLSHNRFELLAKYHAGTLPMTRPTAAQRAGAALETASRAKRRDRDDDDR